MFNPRSIWNQAIGPSPLILPSSAAWIASIQADSPDIIGIRWEGSSAIYQATPATPIVTMRLPDGRTMQAPMQPDYLPDPHYDGHIIVISAEKRRAYGFYHANPVALVCDSMGWCDITVDGDGLASWGDPNQPMWGGGRAGGSPFIAGLITREELASGVIPHTIALGLRLGRVSSTAFQWPARGTDGSGGAIPMGVRLQLDPSTPYPAAWQGNPKAAKVIWDALKNYGAILFDTNNSGPQIWCESRYLASGALDLTYYTGIAQGWEWQGFPFDKCRFVEVKQAEYYTNNAYPTSEPPPPAGPLVVGDWATNLSGSLAPMKVIAVGSTKLQTLAVSGSTLIRRELTKTLYKRATPSAPHIVTWREVLHGLWPEIV